MNADFMFVLDISDSIIDEYLDKVLDFVGEFVEYMSIGPMDDRVGVVVFGDSGNVMFTMSEHQNKTNLSTALGRVEAKVNKIRDKNIQQTNTADGLTETIDVFNSDIREPRQSNTVYRAAIVLSDGVSNDHDATIREAKELHSLTPPVLVYAIGVGGVNEEEMNAIASDCNHYTHLDNFDPEGFHRVRKNYLEDICLIGNVIIKA